MAVAAPMPQVRWVTQLGNSTWTNLLDPFPDARGTAKNTFTTFQDIYGLTGDRGSLPMSQGNELKVGTRIFLDARGEFSNTGTPTLQLGFIYNATPAAAGGTTIAASGTITTTTAATAWPWILEWDGFVSSIGAAGANSVIYGQGMLQLGTSLIAFAGSAIPITAAARSVSFDSTISALWGIGAAWGTSNASNTVRCDTFTVRIGNQGKT